MVMIKRLSWTGGQTFQENIQSTSNLMAATHLVVGDTATIVGLWAHVIQGSIRYLGFETSKIQEHVRYHENQKAVAP